MAFNINRVFGVESGFAVGFLDDLSLASNAWLCDTGRLAVSTSK